MLVIAMTILWLAALGIASSVVGHSEPQPDQDEANRVLVLMLVVSTVNTAVVSYAILRAKWRGLMLAGVVALQIFGIQFFISQIETLYFNFGVQMPERLIVAIVIAGFFLAIVFSIVAVAVWGRMRRRVHSSDVDPVAGMTPGRFTMAFLLLSVLVYPAIYITAGHFIAWQFEDVRMFYTGSAHLAGFGRQLWTFVSTSLYPYQILRGMLWILIALPLIRMLNGGLWEKSMVVAAMFSCLMSSQLILPNPYMPGEVAFAHLIETSISNAAWGMIVGFVMSRPYSSSNDSQA